MTQFLGNNVCSLKVEGCWLDANAELQICLAQPQLVPLSALINDSTRVESLSLATQLFTEEGGQVRLYRWFEEKPGILLFPEFSFGSGDFDALDQLITSYPGKLIVLAGFGAVKGASLISLLSKCEATWSSGSEGIDSRATYNAGWCWTHLAPGQTKRHVFLKNFFEQNFEVAAIPGITRGTSIFKIETCDLALYPLICADLISNENQSPRNRIRDTLPKLQNGQPDPTKKVVVAALLYDTKPFHNLWHSAISDVGKFHNRTAALISVNQVVAELRAPLQEDYWRCLSGAFVNKSIMSDPPKIPLPTVRFVKTEDSSGLILRQSKPGIACGCLRWQNAADVGRGVWRPQTRLTYENGVFATMSEAVGFIELKRYLKRKRTEILAPIPEALRPQIELAFSLILNDPVELNITSRLWPKLLSGTNEANEIFSPDAIDEFSAYLNPAIGMLAAIQSITNSESISGPPQKGQLKWNSAEILLWNAPLIDWHKIEWSLQESAKKYPFEPCLVVLAKSGSGHVPLKHELKPGRLLNITGPREIDDITDTRSRRVLCTSFGEAENILSCPIKSETQKKAAIIAHLSPD